MSLCVGRFSSLLVLLAAAVLAGLLPTTCLADNHGNHTDNHTEDDHDQDHDHSTTTTDDHDHDHDHETTTTESHDHDHDHETTTTDDHDHDHDHETTTTDDHDHDHDDDHESTSNTSSGTGGVIYGEFNVVVDEDQESMLKDAKVVEAFEKAYAKFAGVADTAVHVKFLDDVDHSGHGHRRLRQLAAQHEQDGEYEIKTTGLADAKVQAAVQKLKMAKETTSKANELKTTINSQIQSVPGFTSLQIQKVTLLTSPVVKAATSTGEETKADFATQASCPWMHYSLFAVALVMNSLA